MKQLTRKQKDMEHGKKGAGGERPPSINGEWCFYKYICIFMFYIDVYLWCLYRVCVVVQFRSWQRSGVCNIQIIRIILVFGWWSTFLGDGQAPGALTIYFKKFPRPGTQMEKEFRPKDVGLRIENRKQARNICIGD